MKKALVNYARHLGFAAIGVTDVAPLTAEEALLAERATSGRQSPFEAGEPPDRCRPARLLPGARSVISVALAYGRPFPRPPAASVPPGLRGEVSRYAWGRDYHVVLRQKLKRLAALLDEVAPGGTHRVLVDTTPLLERALAQRAGLGWIGKNTCLITPRQGSWVFLGEIVTTLALPPDPPFPAANACGDCDRCLQACPTGALVSPGVLDYRRCLAYLTQAREIPNELRPALGRRVWGCDTCQTVCPHNRKGGEPAVTVAPATLVDLDEARPPLLDLLAMGKGEFRRRFGATAAAWRGRVTLRRNALVALGNSRRPEGLPAVLAALADGHPEIRRYAAWALGRYEER